MWLNGGIKSNFTPSLSVSVTFRIFLKRPINLIHQMLHWIAAYLAEQTDAVTAWWPGLTDSSTTADKGSEPLEGSEPFSMCCQAVRTPASVSLGWVAAWWESAALEGANLALVILLLTKAATNHTRFHLSHGPWSLNILLLLLQASELDLLKSERLT